GVKVILWTANSSGAPVSKIDSTVTAGGGKYTFTNLPKGDYIVQIVLSTLPDSCTISPKKDVGPDATDNDFGTNGLSNVVKLDPAKGGLDKDNPTIDAGLITLEKPCVKPEAGPDQTLVCGPNGAPSTIDLPNAKAGEKWIVLSVQPSTTVSITTPGGMVSGMTAPGEYKFVLQVVGKDSLTCRDTVSVIVPNCACPTVNVLTPNATVCKDSLWPTLQVAIVGGNTQGITASWFANATGGTALGTGLSFKPAGVATATDTFYVQLNGVPANCQQTPRTPVIVKIQNCNVEIDLALRKKVNKKVAAIGEEVTFTIQVFNQLATKATLVEVKDTIATTVQFVAGSFVASRGNATISGNVIKWTIGTMNPSPDTVTLTYKVKATQAGIHFNTAEISNTNEKDKDSTPNNGKDGEDDIDFQCFSTPAKLCPGEKVMATVPLKYTNVKWFKDGGSTPVAQGNSVSLTETGTYTFTATNKTCPSGGCCTVVIEPGTDCCPPRLCVPVIVKLKRK
ncbi:MAG: SdrD B-like domain-containing protein, partial [Runella sp.]